MVRFTVGKQDKKLGHENGPTNNFLSLGWNITKLPHRIELDIPKNRMFFCFLNLLHFGGKMTCQLWRQKIKHELRT
jgi:hypothetical protein